QKTFEPHCNAPISCATHPDQDGARWVRGGMASIKQSMSHLSHSINRVFLAPLPRSNKWTLLQAIEVAAIIRRYPADRALSGSTAAASCKRPAGLAPT